MPPPSAETQEFRHMASLTTRDGTTLFYKDWGHGPPVVFSHGWPLSGDAWEAQMLHLASAGFRCIAHDRRGHGRSSQPYAGNDMDTYADDLYALMEHLDLRGAMMVGHSAGGGEVARVIGRHGTSRVGRAVLVGAVAPIMARIAANPDGLPMEVFDGIRAGLLKDRSQLFRDFAAPFFGANRDGSQVSQGMRDGFWLQGMMGGLKNQFDCIAAFSETDLTEDLRKMTVPVLVIHGDDDQVVPVATTAMRTARLVPRASLKIYPGGAHGLADTARERLNADLLAFARS
jgi:non-heme chloroperoxidase